MARKNKKGLNTPLCSLSTSLVKAIRVCARFLSTSTPWRAQPGSFFWTSSFCRSAPCATLPASMLNTVLVADDEPDVVDLVLYHFHRSSIEDHVSLTISVVI